MRNSLSNWKQKGNIDRKNAIMYLDLIQDTWTDISALAETAPEPLNKGKESRLSTLCSGRHLQWYQSPSCWRG